MRDVIEKAKNVRIIIFDVDGVLTDGGMYYTKDGDIMKRFHARDGMGVTLLRKNKIPTVIVTKESTNLRIFIDGVQIGTTVTLGNVGSTDPDDTSTSLNKIMNIGGSTAGSSESTNMYIDNVRISDFARYTSGFTPPTTEHGTQGQ